METAPSVVNLSGREDGHVPPRSGAFQNARRHTSCPQFLLMSWCFLSTSTLWPFPTFESGVIEMALHVGMCQIFLRVCWYWLSRRNCSTHLSFYSVDGVALCLLEPALTTDLPIPGSVSNVQYLYHQCVTHLTSLVRKRDRCSVYRRVDIQCHSSSFVEYIDVWNSPNTKKQAETLPDSPHSQRKINYLKTKIILKYRSDYTRTAQ
jgi:hypothetical protein